MGAVEIRESPRGIERGLVVERRVERGIAGGCCVGRSGPGVCSLEITTGPTARQRGLPRVIVRVSIVGKKLEAGVAVDALNERTRDRVGKGVGGDGIGVAAGIGQGDRVRGSILRLQAVASLAQMN